ncbi:MAG: ATP-binding cassette domain-containing protein [Cyclobacteriaceae bacterium]|nr:ATP-binding cassette domain-containing protein [Cyclobacteriaceae bacterium]
MKLEFDSISLEFGMHRVLSSVHMVCNTGEIIGLLGRNGSGKSCLMRIVFGSVPAQSKSVRVNGEYLIGNYMRQKIIGYLPQHGLLPDFVTFGEALNLFGVKADRIESGFPELTELLNQKPFQVSGGQRRLFEALLILFSDHPFCFLDEPFSGLMPAHAERLTEIIKKVKPRKGIIISDHLHRQVRSIADKLYVLANGKTYPVQSEEQLVELGYLTNL